MPPARSWRAFWVPGTRSSRPRRPVTTPSRASPTTSGRGLTAVRDCDVAVLGDHDDVWHPDRVAHQAALLEEHPDVSLRGLGRPTRRCGRAVPWGARCASTFRVPDDFNDMSPADRMRFVLRKSVATGGASAVRPAAFADVEIPEGWLHDRWWSLVAAAARGTPRRRPPWSSTTACRRTRRWGSTREPGPGGDGAHDGGGRWPALDDEQAGGHPAAAAAPTPPMRRGPRSPGRDCCAT